MRVAVGWQAGTSKQGGRGRVAVVVVMVLTAVPGALVVVADEARADLAAIMNASFSTGREYTSAVWDGTHAYIFGGFHSGPMLDEIVRYDPATDTTTVMGATVPSKVYATSAVWDGTHAYIFGGYNGVPRTQIVRYDPASDTATLMGATLPTPRQWTSAIWDGTHAYIFGGSDGWSHINQILRYDPAADTVTVMGATFSTGRFGTSAVWDGTHAYIFGGARDGGLLREIVRYDPAADTLTVVGATLPCGRQATGAAWDGTNAYVFGGGGCGGHINQIVRFNPAAGAVTVMSATLPSGRVGPSAVWDGSNAYVFAGSFVNEIVRYNPHVPGAPQSLAAVAGPGVGQISLQWQAPTSDGGLPIAKYRVYRSDTDGGPYAWVADATGSSHTDSGLPNGATRHYKVSAVNAAGEGPLGTGAAATTFDVPGPPRALGARVAPHVIQLGWEAPADDGGTPVFNYKLYRGNASGQVAFLADVGMATTFTDPEPDPGVATFYRVTAVNLVGEGDPSKEATATIPGKVLVHQRGVPLVPATPLPPVGLPPAEAPVATVAGRNAPGGRYCVDLTPSGGTTLEVACAATLGIAVPDVGPVTIVSELAPAGSAGGSPAVTADIKVRFYYDPGHVVDVASLLGGAFVLKAPIAPTAAEADWLLAHGADVDVQVLAKVYVDGEPAPAETGTLVIPVVGQLLGAVLESQVGGASPL